jgi:hypothetical protein
MRQPQAALAVAARAGYAIMLYVVGVAVLGGAVVLAALWSHFLGLLLMVIILGSVGFWLSDVVDGCSVVFRVFAPCALLAAAVSSVALSFVVTEDALRDRGIVEQAVVVAEHYACINDGEGDCLADYSYTLRSTAGPLIRPDLDNGSSRLAIGSRLMVLADPLGRLKPSTNTRLSAGPSQVTALISGGVAATCLLVVAWTAPRPSRH